MQSIDPKARVNPAYTVVVALRLRYYSCSLTRIHISEADRVSQHAGVRTCVGLVRDAVVPVAVPNRPALDSIRGGLASRHRQISVDRLDQRQLEGCGLHVDGLDHDGLMYGRAIMTSGHHVGELARLERRVPGRPRASLDKVDERTDEGIQVSRLKGDGLERRWLHALGVCERRIGGEGEGGNHDERVGGKLEYNGRTLDAVGRRKRIAE